MRFVTGECDTLIGEAHQRRHHPPHFSQARLVEIPGAGHTMVGEKPEETIHVIRGSLDQQSA